ncbi:XRE family transcriptional regulator (plasmid) [Streptomyces sp. NBC_00868]|uniref:XRE family transcriptional regulator n=1 Tax=Streptomyces sp. NBC_00868 TaxID=2903683 RepID=UPI002F90DAD9|nr:XRE family transcriptional regulator [Streptomyces sp. NBC_00868]
MQTQRAATDEAANRAYRDTAELPITEIASFLQEQFSQRVVARLAGIEDPKQVGRWSRGLNGPRFDSEFRLRTAFQVFRYIEECENRHVARAWMMGMNPQLEDESPLLAIADERFKEVMAAARSYRQGDL